jgi:hypothetical protein
LSFSLCFVPLSLCIFVPLHLTAYSLLLTVFFFALCDKPKKNFSFESGEAALYKIAPAILLIDHVTAALECEYLTHEEAEKMIGQAKRSSKHLSAHCRLDTPRNFVY